MSRSSGAPMEWTYAEYARLPDDGNRYEVTDGEVCVTPAPGPRHQRIAAKLFMLLHAYVQKQHVGEMLWDVDLLFVNGQFLRPDMVFVPTNAQPGVTDRGVESVPGLVVEVLSPHSSKIDRVLKPPRYRDFGVPEYWVVDPHAKSIEAYRLQEKGVEPEVHTVVLRWQPDPTASALELGVPEVFEAG
jgi:Uma2 family endonuclease